MGQKLLDVKNETNQKPLSNKITVKNPPSIIGISTTVYIIKCIIVDEYVTVMELLYLNLNEINDPN